MEYLAQGTTAGDASMRAQRALYDLIRIEAVAASFSDEETADRAAALVAQLEGGKSVQDLAKEVGTLPGAAADGRIELTRNSMHGPRFEQIAFATPAGARAAPFRTAQGIVLLQVEKHEKGETPDTDKVALHAALVPYTADAAALQKVHNAVNFGQIDIVARDQQTLDLLPPLFRPQPQHSGVPAAAPVPGRDTTALQEALGMLAKEIAALQDASDEASVAKRRALEARYEQLKRELRSAEAGEETDRVAPDKVEPGKVEPTPTEPPKKQGCPPRPHRRRPAPSLRVPQPCP
jgi:hypothetical protein